MENANKGTYCVELQMVRHCHGIDIVFGTIKHPIKQFVYLCC